MKIPFLLGLLLLAITRTAMAHPGHGATDPHSPQHYLMEPQHAGLALALLVIAVLIAGYGLRNRSKPRRTGTSR